MDSIAIIINNHAKNAQLLPNYLAAFDRNHLTYQVYQVDCERLDETIKQCMTTHPIVLIGGGDGTIRSAAQWCVDTPTIMGVLPLGTLNHFAKELNLPFDADELAQALNHKQTVKIDVAEVNGSIFINNSSLGFYPRVARKRAYYTKFYNKWLTYLPSLIYAFKKHKTLALEINSADKTFSLITSFLMISNNLYSYQFPLRFERESFTQGVLGMYYLKYGKMRIVKILRALFNPKREFEMKQSTTPVAIRIQTHEDISISLDGDTVVMQSPLIYKTRPQSLILLTKPS